MFVEIRVLNSNKCFGQNQRVLFQLYLSKQGILVLHIPFYI